MAGLPTALLITYPLLGRSVRRSCGFSPRVFTQRDDLGSLVRRHRCHDDGHGDKPAAPQPALAQSPTNAAHASSAPTEPHRSKDPQHPAYSPTWPSMRPTTVGNEPNSERSAAGRHLLQH
jgi:hypothetical protein